MTDTYVQVIVPKNTAVPHGRQPLHRRILSTLRNYLPGASLEMHEGVGSFTGTPEPSVKIAAHSPTLETDLTRLEPTLTALVREHGETHYHLVINGNIGTIVKLVEV